MNLLPSCSQDPSAWYCFPITQNYGTNGEKGVDLGTPFHTDITSLYSGVVTDASYQPWGGQVGIETNIPGVGNVIWYVQHLDQINVTQGQSVSVGQLLGLSGGQTSGGSHPSSSQYSSGAHTEEGFNASWIGGVQSGMPNFNPDSLLQQAKSGQDSGGVSPLGYSTGSSLPGWINTITQIGGAFNDPNNTARVLLFIVGFMIVILGLIRLTDADKKVISGVKKGVSTASKVAVLAV